MPTYYASQFGKKEIINERVRDTDLIGIIFLTTSVDKVTEIVKDVQEMLPDIKIVLGNIHASLFCEDILKNNLVEFIVHREGEYTLLKLLNALEVSQDISKVKGISFISNG